MMSFENLPDGLYLVSQRSVKKKCEHYGILDIGNRLRHPHANGLDPVVVHQAPPGLKFDWLAGTGQWKVHGKIQDEKYAIQRLGEAAKNSAYDLFGNNCEHFARYVATGVRESKQLQAVGFFGVLWGLVWMAAG